MEKKNVSMQIINPHCAGIDIGSRSHYVAIDQELSEVKEFGVYADDLTAICTHLKLSGGKLLSTKTPKGSNRLKIALRNAANAIGNLKGTHLSNFFNRICYRKGRTVAVSATARKLAVIIWNMIVKNIPYIPPTEYLFLDEKRRLGLAKRIKKQIDKFGFTNEDLGFVTT